MEVKIINSMQEERHVVAKDSKAEAIFNPVFLIKIIVWTSEERLTKL